MSKTLSLFVLALFVGLSACKKDEIDLATLNTNPFDADYTGAPIFTFHDEETITQVINGTLVRRLRVTVRVHTEIFGRPTTYIMRVTEQPSGNAYTISSNNVVNGLVTLQVSAPPAGEQSCWDIELGNGGNYSARNVVCGTAE